MAKKAKAKTKHKRLVKGRHFAGWMRKAPPNPKDPEDEFALTQQNGSCLRRKPICVPYNGGTWVKVKFVEVK